MMYVSRIFFFLLLSACSFLSGPSWASELQSVGGRVLYANYQQVEPSLRKSQFGLPIYIESVEEGNTSLAEIYGVLDYPFDKVRGVLEDPGNWCEIVFLHVNIKACTYEKSANNWLLTLFSGRKTYQEPDAAYELKYLYRMTARQPDYTALLLTADEGPLSTKNYRIEVKMIPLAGEKTLVFMSYRFSYGAVGRLAMKTYFATVGSGKVGFSSTGKDTSGNPIYVGGIQGAIERNVVRYFYAIQSHVEMVKFPKSEQFDRRIQRWYDLTDKNRKQLYELSREEYLGNKKKEYQNQLILQRKLTG